MGCSMTEGRGSYDPTTFTSLGENIRLVNKKNEKRFLKYSWGSVLQEKLKYDRYVNMGIGGSSTSGQVKLFYEKLSFIESLKEYDVLLVWLLPIPFRFSFYTQGANADIIPGSVAYHDKTEDSEIDKAYIKFLDDLWHDSFLEQNFYKNIIKLSTEYLGFKFLYTSVVDQVDCNYTNPRVLIPKAS